MPWEIHHMFLLDLWLSNLCPCKWISILYEDFDYTSINMDPKTFCQRHLSLHLCVGGYYCVNSFASPSLLPPRVCFLLVCVCRQQQPPSINKLVFIKFTFIKFIPIVMFRLEYTSFNFCSSNLFHVMSCHVMFCLIMFCHVMSCHVMSRHVVSGRVVLCCVHQDSIFLSISFPSK